MVKALTRRLANCGLVPLRVALSLVFIGHGGQKLFVMGISGTSAFMSGIGIPAPTLAAVVVIFVELLGGIAVLLGVWARWAAVCLSIDMLVALLLVQVTAGVLRPGGFEFVLVLLAGTVTIVLLGPGNPSLGRDRSAGRSGVGQDRSG